MSFHRAIPALAVLAFLGAFAWSQTGSQATSKPSTQSASLPSGSSQPATGPGKASSQPASRTVVDVGTVNPATRGAYTVAFVPICVANNTDREKQCMASLAKDLTKAFGDSSIAVIDFDAVAKVASAQQVEGFVMANADDIQTGGVTGKGLASLHDSSKTKFGSELVGIAKALPPACNIIIYFGPCRADDGKAQAIQVYVTKRQQVVDETVGRWWQMLEVLNTSIESPKFSDDELRAITKTMRGFKVE